MYYSDIVLPCLVKNCHYSDSLTLFKYVYECASYVYLNILPSTISPFHHLPLYHLMTFAYFLISDYSGKMSKLIQKYQDSDEALVCNFEKVKAIKRMDVVQVPSWSMRNFLSFKSSQ